MSEDNFTTEEGAVGLESSRVKARIKYSRVKRKILKYVWLVRVLIISAAILVFAFAGFGAIKLSGTLGLGNILGLAYNFVFPSTDQVASEMGRTNILVMGMGGKGHQGSELTDTLLLTSVSLNRPSTQIVSIPRDIWIPEIRAKINSAYYWGNQKSPGGGISLAKSVAEEVTGAQIQYAILVDFSGFKKIVDELGGINVNVETSFVDPLYPIAGRENDLCDDDREFKCRYETISFSKGPQKMNGATALKFVRSRHAEGIEGTDIAREARQQKVIEAIKNKILTPQIFLNPKKVIDITKAVGSSIETDLDVNTAAILARKFFDGRKSVKNTLVPRDLLDNPPISPTYDKQYVFIPKAGNGKWNDINDWVKTVLQ